VESAVLFAAVLLLVRTSKKESIKLDCVGIAHIDMSLHLGIGDELTTVVFFFHRFTWFCQKSTAENWSVMSVRDEF